MGNVAQNLLNALLDQGVQRVKIHTMDSPRDLPVCGSRVLFGVLPRRVTERSASLKSPIVTPGATGRVSYT